MGRDDQELDRQSRLRFFRTGRTPWHTIMTPSSEARNMHNTMSQEGFSISCVECAAEAEEHEFYTRRASPEYIKDLGPLGTNHQKPYFDIVPWVVVVFKLVKDTRASEDERFSEQVYYLNESVGIATGLFLAAAQNAGLSTLTHTPNPMRFLTKILNRPSYERPYVVIPVGYPSEDCKVPDVRRKTIEEIMVIDREGDFSDEDR